MLPCPSVYNDWDPILRQLWQLHHDDVKVVAEEEDMYEVYPPPEKRWRAFELCPLEKTKVCIIGQDPYHNEGEADGLCFSVPQGVKIPPSLRNIFKELSGSYGTRTCTDLSDWARQGVLLLNTALTVRAGKPGSYTKAWKNFTTDLIKYIGNECKGVVFMLWGAHAQSFEPYIDKSKHMILKHSHPSPLSRKLFFGNKHFIKCNEFLKEQHGMEIDWTGVQDPKF